MIAVRVDGNGPYRFVVDTGADRTVLATEVAGELGLFHGEKVKLEGLVRSVFADTVSIRTLSFGSITRRHLVVPTLSRSLLTLTGILVSTSSMVTV